MKIPLNTHDQVYILMPVFNESEVLQNTIDGLKVYFKNIIAVNDASTDNSREILAHNNILTINHPVNLGQGAAIETGFKHISKINNAKALITFDSDGQHDPKDASRFAKEIIKCDEEIIFGSRFLEFKSNIPFFKSLLLRLAVFFNKFLIRIILTDTHNGLKAYKIDAVKKINISNQGYAFESELLMEVVKNKLTYKEMPTEIKYTEYSISKGQSMANALVIAEDIIGMLINRRSK